MRTKTNELQKISAIATPTETGNVVVPVPRSWLHKRCWVLTQSQYDKLRDRRKRDGDED
jgi:hypothetical protein